MAELSERAQRIMHIVDLLGVYPRQDQTPEMFRRMCHNWADDLTEYHPDAIGAACATWRRHPDNKFSPHPGALLALCKVERDRILQDKLERVESAHRINTTPMKQIARIPRNDYSV